MQIHLAKDVKVDFQSPAFHGKLRTAEGQPTEYTYGRSAKILATFTPTDIDYNHQTTRLARRVGMNPTSNTREALASVHDGGSLRWRIGIDMGIHGSGSNLGDNGFLQSTMKGFIRVRDDCSQEIFKSLCDVYKQHEGNVKLTVHVSRIQCISERDCKTFWPHQMSFTEENVTCIFPLWYGVEKTGPDVADNNNQNYWKLSDRISSWNAYVTIIARVPDFYADAASFSPSTINQ